MPQQKRAPKKRKAQDDSLYGDETAEARAWAADYIARNREMLDSMARL